jgi:hypothetical protein
MEEQVDITISKKTNFIVMHQVELQVTKASLINKQTGKEIDARQILYNNTLNYVYFIFGTQLISW